LALLAQDRLLVAESGIEGKADISRLSGHVNGFLVGTALMRSHDPAGAARQLVFGRVKLCGLTTAEDVQSGRAATFAGFVFAPGTSRCVTAEKAAPLATLARSLGVKPVGVFKNGPVTRVAELVTQLNFDAVQLHGREDAGYVKRLRRQLPSSCEIWTVVSVGRDASANRGGDRTVFDNGEGGTGRTFDWDLVRAHPDLPRSLVAGGIGPGNARAAADLGPFSIDVGSALDVAPGVKSPEKTRALFEALRTPCRKLLGACA